MATKRIDTGALFNETPAERPKATRFLNIGAVVKLPHEEGKPDSEFVSLPLGLGLDTMEKKEIRGNSPRYRKIMAVKNAILDKLMETADGIAPGSSEIVEGLQMQVLCVGEGNTEVDTSDVELPEIGIKIVSSK